MLICQGMMVMNPVEANIENALLLFYFKLFH